MELSEEARRSGHAKAAFNLGDLYRQKSDLQEAMELHEEARRGGHTKAAYGVAP